MANQKSSVFASRKGTIRTKPATTHKVTTPEGDGDGPILSRSIGRPWLNHASSINSALAESARREDDATAPDDVCTILTYLSYSPKFRLLVEDLRKSLSLPSGDEEDWCTTLFAARVYQAGLIAGRRESAEVSR